MRSVMTEFWGVIYVFYASQWRKENEFALLSVEEYPENDFKGSQSSRTYSAFPFPSGVNQIVNCFSFKEKGENVGGISLWIWVDAENQKGEKKGSEDDAVDNQTEKEENIDVENNGLTKNCHR